MTKRNTPYYIAAGGAVMLLVTAIIGLSSFGADKAAASSQEEALRNAYEQGYLDGYSSGYQEAYNSAAEYYTEQIRTMYATPTRTGCASSSSCAVPVAEPDGDEVSE